jgi:hypothetical protein
VDAARRDPKGGTVHLHFKGMNDDQARAFSQAGELHVGNGRPVKIRTSVEGGEEGSLRLLGELRDGKWDAGRATIRVVDEAPVARVSKVEFEIAVPERATSRSLLMRVEVSFRQGVRATSEFISRLSDTILSMLRELLAGSPDLDLLTASRQIMRTLRAQDESIANVKLRIRSQSGEIHVVRNVLASPDSLGE